MKSRALDAVMLPFTNLGLGGVQAAVVIGLAFAQGIARGEVRGSAMLRSAWRAIYSRRWWVSPLLVSFVVCGFIGADGIKRLVHGERPWWFYENEHRAGRFLKVRVDTVPGVYPLKVQRFPSGHTATSAGMATVVTILFWKRKRGDLVAVGAWIFALAIGLSRIYLGSHWPLDVLGGVAVGVVGGAISVWACRMWASSQSSAVSRQSSGGSSDGAGG